MGPTPSLWHTAPGVSVGKPGTPSAMTHTFRGGEQRHHLSSSPSSCLRRSQENLNSVLSAVVWPGPAVLQTPWWRCWRWAPRRSPEGSWGWLPVCTTGYLQGGGTQRAHYNLLIVLFLFIISDFFRIWVIYYFRPQQRQKSGQRTAVWGSAGQETGCDTSILL